MDDLGDWQRQVPAMRNGRHLQLLEAVAQRRAHETVYPPQPQIFQALLRTPLSGVKVVILGQDPYHGPGQANGLAFSVPQDSGVATPPSLRNIFKEIKQDVYPDRPYQTDNDLNRWAGQGVLLLNTSLSVAAGKAGSHNALGWSALTDDIIATVSHRREHVVFMLWGRHAQAKKALIDADRHLVLEAAHPSPLSARNGFFGCRHFSRANAYLREHGEREIVW